MYLPMWEGIKARLKNQRAKTRNFPNLNMTRDHVNLDLWGVHLTVSRETTSPIPSELTVIIPRAEFRHNCQSPDQCETEIILSSITIVLSPRHPQEGGSNVPAIPPPIKNTD